MELIDIDALAKRLENGDITLILDHSDEMSKADLAKISKYEKCVIYPPFGYTTKEATLKKQDIFISNIKNFLNNSPKNRIN